MKFLLIAITVNALYGGTAVASAMCAVPIADWQPREALQAKLEGGGWKVRSIKSEGGCYEAHAVDSRGRNVEAYFNPKSFEVLDINAKD